MEKASSRRLAGDKRNSLAYAKVLALRTMHSGAGQGKSVAKATDGENTSRCAKLEKDYSLI
jgi:hypothetical protein